MSPRTTSKSLSLFGVLFICFFCTFREIRAKSVPNDQSLPLGNATCPQILRCNCLNDDRSQLHCRHIGHQEIEEISKFYPSLKSLTIEEWAERSLNLTKLVELSSLIDLSIKDSTIDHVDPSRFKWKSLKRLKMPRTSLGDPKIVCNLTTSMVHLNLFDMSRSGLEVIDKCLETTRIDVLKLSNNMITRIEALPANLLVLDVLGNKLTEVSLPQSLQRFDISENPIQRIDPISYPKLRFANMSSTAFSSLPMIEAPLLTEFYIEENQLISADLSRWKTPMLKTFSLASSPILELVYGNLPASVKKFSLTETRLSELPRDFFQSNNLTALNVSSDRWNCDKCSYKWAARVEKFLDRSVCPKILPTTHDCDFGCDQSKEVIFRVRYGVHVVLRCGCHSRPAAQIDWFLYRPRTLLGSFDPLTNKVTKHPLNETGKQFDGKYQILPNGLLISAVDRPMLERFVCVLKRDSKSTHQIVKLRLDYSHWYSLNVLDSIFWGSLITSFLVCLLSFVLNVIWILSRKSILWWIKRAERLSRVRKMVEAMEKYRSRQMEALHETYSRRVQNVRDNYHYQVEQLRHSYASQALRFRDFREAKMENVTSHLESIRDNYNQQMQRVREYGSRRADQLWESYERQMNRMRMFSLQQRLKVMRQYKVKQRYVNKLLESFQDTGNPEAIQKHEEEVRRALEILKEAQLEPTLDDLQAKGEKDKKAAIKGEGKPLSRTPSYYSLPEYVLDENGELRPSTIAALDLSIGDEFREIEVKKKGSHR